MKSTKSHQAWNKGLTKETDAGVAKHSRSLKNYYKTHKGVWTGKKHSEETKAKISASRKKYLAEHPDKIPFKMYHSSKESYPEQYFRKWLKKEHLLEAQELQVDRYTLDFAWPDKKIYLEIDGNQHKLDWMQKHDRTRTEYLNSLGWSCIERVEWSWYQSLNKKEKHSYLQNLKSAIQHSHFVERFISKKELKLNRRKKLIAEGYVNNQGRLVPHKILNEEWEKRFQLIIQSKVDLKKFGWKPKVSDITGLTIPQINRTINHYSDYFKAHAYIYNSQPKNKRSSKKQKTEERKQLILNSGIDFTKRGWISKISKLIEKPCGSVVAWLQRNMKDFYNQYKQ